MARQARCSKLQVLTFIAELKFVTSRNRVIIVAYFISAMKVIYLNGRSNRIIVASLFQLDGTFSGYSDEK